MRFVPAARHMGPVSGLYGFVSRWGALCIDDGIVAMAAIPASARTAPALTQEQLLDHAAVALGEGFGARDLVRAIMEDFGTTAIAVAERLRPSVRHFDSTR